MVLIMKDLRLSSYTISVKLEAEEDKFFLVHGYTGAIDIVEGECWRQIEHFSSNNSLSEETIRTLQKRGYLTARTPEEELQYVWKIANVLHKAQAKMKKFWSFVITYDCNFRCPYCFENKISKNGSQWTKMTFTKEMVDKAYQTMNLIEPHRELHQDEILLYGGEPCLRNNKDIVAYIIKKGIEGNYKFKIISNGYDLDYYEGLLSKDYINGIQITIDGYKTKHNMRKQHIVEGDSFDKVVSNIGMVLRKEIHVILRINIDENNSEDLVLLKKFFVENGFAESPYFYFSPAILIDTKAKCNTKDIKFFSSEAFIKMLEDKSLVENQDFQIKNTVLACLKNRKCYKLKSTICPSQYGSYMFDPYGDIYTCLETVGQKQHSIGNYKENLIWTKEKVFWFSKNISNMECCSKCRYALLCGGRCLAKTLYTKDKGFEVTECKKFGYQFPRSINFAYNTFLNKFK